MSLIHIPNTTIYAIASLTNLTLGSFFISSHISQRWLKKFNFTLLDANAFVKCLIVLFGFTVISPEAFFHGGLVMQSIGLAIGCFLGILYYKFEVQMVKLFPKTINFSSNNMNLLQFKSNNIKNFLNNKSKPVTSKQDNHSYLSAGMVATFEEVLFRGFLTLLCFNLPNLIYAISCLCLVNLAFALSHINLGYLHVFTKLILGFICLISFVIIDSIFMPIAIHTTFNLLAIKKIRESNYA